MYKVKFFEKFRPNQQYNKTLNHLLNTFYHSF